MTLSQVGSERCRTSSAPSPLGGTLQFKQSKQLFYSDAHFSLAGGYVAFLLQLLWWHTLPAGESWISQHSHQTWHTGESAWLLFTRSEQVVFHEQGAAKGSQTQNDTELTLCTPKYFVSHKKKVHHHRLMWFLMGLELKLFYYNDYLVKRQ